MTGPAVGRRRRRWVLPLAAVLAALLVAAGLGWAVRSYLRTAGPDGAVRAYFDALARSDAPTALAYGTVPEGSADLLTSAVLREQQRIAPLDGLSVRTESERGDRAKVRAKYTLNFAGHPLDMSDLVAVHRTDDGWRLDRAAIETQVQVVQAAHRATLAGAHVPEGDVLLFPGAVPIRFDTPYLRAIPAQDVVSAGSGASTQIGVVPTDAGRTAVLVAVRNALRACLAGTGGTAALRCPQPSERYVPGSVRGTIAAPVADGVTIDVGDEVAGVFEVRGKVQVHGSFRRLEFDNALTVKRDTTFSVPVRASAYTVAPITLRWDRPA